MLNRLIAWKPEKKHFVKKTWIAPIVSLGLVLLLALVGCPTRQYVHRTYTSADPAKTQYIVVADTHWYSPYGLSLSLDEVPDGENTMYLGDIYEVQYAPKKKVKEIIRTIKQFKQTKGDRYVQGNHECQALSELVSPDNTMGYYANNGEWIPVYEEVDYVIRPKKSKLPQERILFLHGHKIAPRTDSGKIPDCTVDEGGIGWWEQLGLRVLGRLTSPKRLEPIIPNAIRLALTLNCRTIVFGHTHVKELFDEEFQDQETGEMIRVIAVPPGITHLEL